MNEESIDVDRRRYQRVPLTRNVAFTVAMRTEMEMLQPGPAPEGGRPTYEISATINLRQEKAANPVSYDLIGTLTPREPPERELAAVTKNVSQGGLCIETSFKLQENQVVRIGLPVPEYEVTTPTLAEVRWLRPEGNAVRAGLRYLL